MRGPKGEIRVPVLLGVEISVEGKEIHCGIQGARKQIRSNWGTLRSLLENAVEGVTKGFQKTLILEGVGFRISKQPEGLQLLLGLSHPVLIQKKEGIEFEVEKNILRVKGIHKELVGETAAKIRALKKPEPYKGKGFRYENEVIRRKAGKKAGGAVK